jgi:hypothetical protein
VQQGELCVHLQRAASVWRPCSAGAWRRCLDLSYIRHARQSRGSSCSSFVVLHLCTLDYCVFCLVVFSDLLQY